MKSAARPILAATRSRLYSSQAAQKVEQRIHLPKQEPKISKLPSGAVVASVENYSPVSRVAVLYNAGSRFEDGTNEGITHCLRNASNLSTEQSTAFAVTRNIQQIGGNLSCTTTREHMIYSVLCMRDALNVGVEFLGHVATKPAFKVWELAETKNHLNLDLAVLHEQPEVETIEALHQAAYRDALGRSLYMPAHKIGSHTPEMLKDFVTRHYNGSNMAVVGLGVDHDQLVQYAQKYVGVSKLGSGAVSSQAVERTKATYHGGDVRIGTNSELVHAAVVTEGTSLDSKDMFSLAVLQKVMGSGPYIKYSSNLATSRINKAAAQATANPCAVSCINMNYSDSGLFGFYAVTQPADMGKVLKSVIGQFSSVTKEGLKDAEVQRGKAQVKADIAMNMENGCNALHELGVEALLAGRLYTPDEINQAIDKVTTADVQNVAKKVINGKPSMAAVGNLSHTPYVDELM